MEEYHKIQTVYKRNPDTNYKTLLSGQYSIPEFGYLANNTWQFTEKVDGTNIRVGYKEGNIEFGGRTENAQIPAVLTKNLCSMFYPMLELLEETFGIADIVLYGEGYGGKIQKAGSAYGQDQRFVLFDVLIDGWWLNRDNVNDIADTLGIESVPIIGVGSLADMVAMAKAGIISTWGSFQAEGIVARPSTELRTRAGKRVITKIKCRDFLAK